MYTRLGERQSKGRFTNGLTFLLTYTIYPASQLTTPLMYLADVDLDFPV